MPVEQEDTLRVHSNAKLEKPDRNPATPNMAYASHLSRSVKLQGQSRSYDSSTLYENEESGGVMAATHENSGFGGNPMDESFEYFRRILEQNLKYVRKARRQWQCGSRR